MCEVVNVSCTRNVIRYETLTYELAKFHKKDVHELRKTFEERHLPEGMKCEFMDIRLDESNEFDNMILKFIGTVLPYGDRYVWKLFHFPIYPSSKP